MIGSPTWCVQATVDEPVELLCAFAAHHLALGASEVILCVDHPDPAVDAALGNRPGVTLVHRRPVTDGAAPQYHTRRQRSNVNRAYEICPHDWFVSIDADEFLLPRRPMAEILAAIPDDVATVRMPVIERAFRWQTPIRSIFDGVWRAPIPNRLPVMPLIYGKQLDYLTRGMLGHALGKAITRTRRDLRIDLHIAIPKSDPTQPKDLYSRPEYNVWAKDLSLLHFYAMTPTHYLLKMLRKMVDWQAAHPPSAEVLVPTVAPPRKRQYRRIYKHSSNPEVMAEMSRLLFLSLWQCRALRLLNRLRTPVLTLDATAQTMFPDLALDFSAAQFDRRLHERYADMIEATHYVAPTF